MSNIQQWIIDLSMKDNLLYGLPSYIPILLEEIPEYINLTRYEEDYIKEIQTMGKIQCKHKSSIVLCSLTPYTNGKITAVYNTSFLRRNSVTNNRIHDSCLVKDETIKVFGSLRIIEKTIFLDIHLILQVKDPINSLRILSLTSKMTTRKYRQFYHSEKIKKLISKSWKKMYANESSDEI